MLTQVEQQRAAKKFAEIWKERGYEKGETQTFWLTLLRDVYGVNNPEAFINFEERARAAIFTEEADQIIKSSTTNFIDASIPATKVLIEQKSKGKDLSRPIKQSDGTLLTPFQQAKRYSAELPYSKTPRWIIACNFTEFYIYDMEKPGGDPEIVFLEDLERDYYRLNFLVDQKDKHIQKEEQISLAAAELVGLIYKTLLDAYNDPDDEQTLKDLNVFCVRIVFCLYAEDAGIFGKHAMFRDYLSQFEGNPNVFRSALISLFKILDTPIDNRDPYLDESLLAFPYVNGGLFSDRNVSIPRLSPEIINILLYQASAQFNWSHISPF